MCEEVWDVEEEVEVENEKDVSEETSDYSLRGDTLDSHELPYYANPTYPIIRKKLKAKEERLFKRKKKVGIGETVALTYECSSLLQRKLPPKLKYSGRFTIPCTIGEERISHALYDLGSSINLMPLRLLKKLKLGDLKSTNMTLTLVDLLITHLYGVKEDVLVNMDGLVFPTNFVVSEY
ncbi:uncharacterized protein LOC127137992 [Lathyrus oleraceus]|uniref:uncharacterized protein LOC127137992 n=1 Tax=Pisum sativum TaxID=3888 RepID=UPI0021CE36D5|nr:uncharacterized protein LOC127137992 [Pisum sativum]